MVKYNYNVEMEAFKRSDNRGKAIYVNVAEAQKIVSMLELGYSVADICGKVSLNSPKGSLTTIKSFIRNYKSGNIEIVAAMFSSPFVVTHFLTGRRCRFCSVSRVLVPFRGNTFLNPVPGNPLFKRAPRPVCGSKTN